MPGQTLAEIRSLLAGAGLAPRHRFGQNFLIDLNLMRKLPAAAELRAADVVLEVGPGTGSLTGLLLESGARVVAVEIDVGLQALLRQQFADHPRFTLIADDVLADKHTIQPRVLAALTAEPPTPPGGYKLVANLPYQVATPLLIDLLCGQPLFSCMVCTVQKEVAQRLAATAGEEAYGPISVVAQTLATVELLATLPPAVFWPRPKVDSTLIRVRPLAVAEVASADAAAFARFVQRGFQTRRKMLRRCVRDWEDVADGEALLTAASLAPDARPETVAPAAWRRLFHLSRRPGA